MYLLRIESALVRVIYTNGLDLALYDPDFDVDEFVEREEERLAAPISKNTVRQYFWWYQFLWLNEDYAKCCSKGGVGEYANFYRDWGDVFRLSFPTWWRRHGRKVAGVGAAPRIVTELRSLKAWVEAYRGRVKPLVVAISLTAPNQKAIWREISKLLRARRKRLP